jgi:hypothetical protein
MISDVLTPQSDITLVPRTGVQRIVVRTHHRRINRGRLHRAAPAGETVDAFHDALATRVHWRRLDLDK